MMPTSTDEQIFGDKGQQGVEVGLPYDLHGRKSHSLARQQDCRYTELMTCQRRIPVPSISHPVVACSGGLGTMFGRPRQLSGAYAEVRWNRVTPLLEVSAQSGFPQSIELSTDGNIV